ncbi:MAG: hypothetical protein IJ773_10405 [Lachnospiraceae bacterium]|nr:hypothetical protein [Lachnospiraceae bacterium]
MKVKAAGYYVTMLACVLSIAAAIAYGVLFSAIEYKEPVFDQRICLILGVAAVVAFLLLVISKPTAGFAPAILCVASGISFMMFVMMVIWPVSDTIYGIDPFPQFTQLVICAALILLTLLFSEVALYMRKYKEA